MIFTSHKRMEGGGGLQTCSLVYLDVYDLGIAVLTLPVHLISSKFNFFRMRSDPAACDTATHPSLNTARRKLILVCM